MSQETRELHQFMMSDGTNRDGYIVEEDSLALSGEWVIIRPCTRIGNKWGEDGPRSLTLNRAHIIAHWWWGHYGVMDFNETALAREGNPMAPSEVVE